MSYLRYSVSVIGVFVFNNSLNIFIALYIYGLTGQITAPITVNIFYYAGMITPEAVANQASIVVLSVTGSSPLATYISLPVFSNAL